MTAVKWPEKNSKDFPFHHHLRSIRVPFYAINVSDFSLGDETRNLWIQWIRNMTNIAVKFNFCFTRGIKLNLNFRATSWIVERKLMKHSLSHSWWLRCWLRETFSKDQSLVLRYNRQLNRSCSIQFLFLWDYPYDGSPAAIHPVDSDILDRLLLSRSL